MKIWPLQERIYLSFSLVSMLSIVGCAHGPQSDVSRNALLANIPVFVVPNREEGTVKHKVYLFANSSVRAPPVLLLHELPGLSPDTLRYAELLSRNFNVYVPLLFGSPNQENFVFGTLAYALNGEWWELAKLEGGRPVTQWIKAVLDLMKSRGQNQPIGVIGMCLTGAMPLALLDEPAVRAVVVAQPALPLLGPPGSLGISDREWLVAKTRASKAEIHVLGIRFERDSIAKRAKHTRLQRELGSAFEDGEIKAREYCGRDSHGRFTLCESSHSTLTAGWSPQLSNDDVMNKGRAAVRQFLTKWLIDSQPSTTEK